MKKPDKCPFCGGRSRIEPIGRYDGGEKFKVRCVECLTVSYGYDSPEEAAEEWNRRYCDGMDKRK